MPTSGPRRGGKRILRPLFGLLVLVILSAAGFFSIRFVRRGATPAVADTTEVVTDSTAAFTSKKDDGTRDERVPVEIAIATRRDVPAFFTGTASLEAEHAARILARTTGQIVRLTVEEGDRVGAGDLLVKLDGAEERIQLEERTADLLQVENELGRQKALFDKNLGAESEYIGTKARYEAAEARKRAAALSLGFAEVRAPFDGIVTQRFVGLGEHVSIGAELLHVVDPDPLLAQVYMSERVARRIRVGQPVVVHSDAGPDTDVTGTISRISPVVDPRTGTVKVTVELEASEAALVPGSFVRVLVETDRHADALVVPERAIIEEGGERFVHRVMGTKARRIRVETGYAHEDEIEILAGLAAGDTVVTAGQGALRSDSEIRPIDLDARTDEELAGETGQGG